MLKLPVQAFYLPVKRALSVVKLPLEGFHLFSEISDNVCFAQHLAQF
jgi:hypothetical protein